VVEVPLDIHPAKEPTQVVGTLIVTLDWIPTTSAPPPPRPSPAAARLTAARGDLFVRAIRAVDLPPVDTKHATCYARVRASAAGQTQQTKAVESLCPVWLEAGRRRTAAVLLTHVAELDVVRLQVVHGADEVGEKRSFLRWSTTPGEVCMCQLRPLVQAVSA
jgi:hypothetical protein